MVRLLFQLRHPSTETQVQRHILPINTRSLRTEKQSDTVIVAGEHGLSPNETHLGGDAVCLVFTAPIIS